jgi:hypothetical protein
LAVSSVGKNPGPMALTHTLEEEYSSAMARVNCATPPLEAPYGIELGNALYDCRLAMLIILPQPLDRIVGISSFERGLT